MIKILKKNNVLNYLLGILVITTLVFGHYYLKIMLKKMRLTQEKNLLIKNNQKLRDNIIKTRMKIDQKVDLRQIETIASKKLKMKMVKEINYIKMNKN